MLPDAGPLITLAYADALDLLLKPGWRVTIVDRVFHELTQPGQTGVRLFEDHRIARASFVLPPQCRKVSTRAFLIFLQERGWIASAAAIERQAVLAGRAFSALRFPP